IGDLTSRGCTAGDSCLSARITRRRRAGVRALEGRRRQGAPHTNRERRVSAVFDTGVVEDYLRGYKPSVTAFKRFPHRAITVATWVEIMAATPEGLSLQTREFLRTFERLAISEGVS